MDILIQVKLCVALENAIDPTNGSEQKFLEDYKVDTGITETMKQNYMIGDNDAIFDELLGIVAASKTPARVPCTPDFRMQYHKNTPKTI